MSETKLIRDEVISYCEGKGIDIGCGGDKVTKQSWGFDLPNPYTNVGNDVIEMRGDARQLPFNDNVLDYIYSSHLLEDFFDTETVLREWIRVLKVGGYIILYLPNEKIYREHCNRTGQPYNLAHTVEEMSLEYMELLFIKLGIKIIKSIAKHETYSFLIIGVK